MSNAPSLKEPSMEEILASIRRIIESGDERSTSVLKTDILHDEPEPPRDTSEHGRARLPVDSPPSWEATGIPHDLVPANGDRLSGLKSPIDDERAVGIDGDQTIGTEEAHATIDAAEPVTASVATTPEMLSTTEGLGPDAVAVLPDTDGDDRRHGLSLARAYRRETSHVDVAVAADGDENAATSYDELIGVAEAPTVVVASPMADVAPVAPKIAAAVAPPTVEDLHLDFDEEQFTSDLRSAVGFDSPSTKPDAAPAAEPTVMAAASTLMSEAAGAQVAAAFDDLARSIRDGQMKSMEDMAREMLRPMLQEWLDDNLPRIVERMVREEIERVSRGPRR